MTYGIRRKVTRSDFWTRFARLWCNVYGIRRKVTRMTLQVPRAKGNKASPSQIILNAIWAQWKLAAALSKKRRTLMESMGQLTAQKKPLSQSMPSIKGLPHRPIAEVATPSPPLRDPSVEECIEYLDVLVDTTKDPMESDMIYRSRMTCKRDDIILAQSVLASLLRHCDGILGMMSPICISSEPSLSPPSAVNLQLPVSEPDFGECQKDEFGIYTHEGPFGRIWCKSRGKYIHRKCELCKAHSPWRWYQCPLCKRWVGAGCDPECCWDDAAKLCQTCAIISKRISGMFDKRPQ